MNLERTLRTSNGKVVSYTYYLITPMKLFGQLIFNLVLIQLQNISRKISG